MINISLLLFHGQSFPARKPSEDARQYAYRMIKKGILELLLLPGHKMNEVDIAASLDMSRTPVHDSFFKLSRENLVDIIPNRGAFVSKIDPQRIEEAVWLHTKLGTSMIQSIYIRKLSKTQLEILYYQLGRLRHQISRRDLTQSAQILSEYYRQLYVLAGNMDLVWNSLQKADMDLQRLLYLATGSMVVVEEFLCELTYLTDSLVARDYDNASAIYSNHMSRIFLLAAPLESQNPQYFTTVSQKNAGSNTTDLQNCPMLRNSCLSL